MLRNHQPDKIENKSVNDVSSSKTISTEISIKTIEKKEEKGRKPKEKQRIDFYKKGGKRRQRYLMDNHAFTTAFIMAILSNYFDIILSFPIKYSTVCLTFPRIRCIIFNDEEDCDIYQLATQRIEILKQEKMINSPNGNHRMNLEMHYEIYHIISDMLYLIEDFEIENVIEEKGGLSGDFSIRIKKRKYQWEEIKKIGEEVIKRIYENRKEGERRRMIKRGSLNDLFI